MRKRTSYSPKPTQVRDGTKAKPPSSSRKAWDGFEIGKPEDKLGIRGAPCCPLFFEELSHVPEEKRARSQEGEGFKIAMKTLDGGRLGIASQALGIAAGEL